MLYVTVDMDDAEPNGYRWRIYDYENPSRPIQEADFPYSTRAAAIDAGWEVAAKLEIDRSTINPPRIAE